MDKKKLCPLVPENPVGSKMILDPIARGYSPFNQIDMAYCHYVGCRALSVSQVRTTVDATAFMNALVENPVPMDVALTMAEVSFLADGSSSAVSITSPLTIGVFFDVITLDQDKNPGSFTISFGGVTDKFSLLPGQSAKIVRLLSSPASHVDIAPDYTRDATTHVVTGVKFAPTSSTLPDQVIAPATLVAEGAMVVNGNNVIMRATPIPMTREVATAARMALLNATNGSDTLAKAFINLF